MSTQSPSQQRAGDQTQTAAELEASWKTDARWDGVRRDYTADDVIELRGPVREERTLARRGAEKLWEQIQANTGNPEEWTYALGALTGNQAVQQVRAGLKAIYLSGWQVAADANLSGQTYPDQSLYPANSVPAVVRRINNALLRAGQIEQDGRDWMAPIVADAEAGFGGPLNAYELMQSMIEAGAAGVHWEDQLASEKKCGHMGGKVLVPTSQHIRTLQAARLAADVSDVPSIIIARTDSLAANLLTSDVDERDQPFLTGGRTAEGFYNVEPGIGPVLARGHAYAEYADLLWVESSEPDLELARTFAESIHAEFPGKKLAYNCSPSFNWKRHLDDDTIAKFQRELSAMGYAFQFITLAGLPLAQPRHVRARERLPRPPDERLRRAAGGRVRLRGARLHRHQAPARSGHRLLRPHRHGPQPGQRDPRSRGLDRVRAVPLDRTTSPRGRAS